MKNLYQTLLNIGELIEKRLKEIQMSHAELARAVNMDQSNMKKLLGKPSMDTGRLVLFSQAMRYNFFMDFSKNEDYKKLKDDEFKIDDSIHIGGIIKVVMQSLKITQEELCDRLMKLEEGISYRRGDISKLVNRKTIDTNKLLKISEALDINFFDFYCMDAFERISWAQEHFANLPGYKEENDSSTFGLEMKRKSKETAEIVEELSRVKAEYAVLQYKYKVLQKRLMDAGMPFEVE